MILVNKFIHFVLVTSIGIGHVASAYGTPETSEVESLCKSYLKSKPATSPVVQFSIWDQLKLILLPDKLVNAQAQMELGKTHRPEYYKTIVFSLGKPRIETVEETRILNDSVKEAKRIRGLFDQLKASSDLVDCMQRAQDYGVNDQALQNFISLESKIMPIIENRMAKYSSDISRKSLIYYKNAHHVPVANWYEIQKYINELPNEKYDFVFKFHAGADGRLYDSQHMIVEKRFFDMILPKVRSMAVFSCFPDRVEERYNYEFNRYLQKDIEVYFPKMKGSFVNIQKTPVGLFSAFMRDFAAQAGIEEDSQSL